MSRQRRERPPAPCAWQLLRRSMASSSISRQRRAELHARRSVESAISRCASSASRRSDSARRIPAYDPRPRVKRSGGDGRSAQAIIASAIFTGSPGSSNVRSSIARRVVPAGVPVLSGRPAHATRFACVRRCREGAMARRSSEASAASAHCTLIGGMSRADARGAPATVRVPAGSRWAATASAPLRGRARGPRRGAWRSSPCRAPCRARPAR